MLIGSAGLGAASYLTYLHYSTRQILVPCPGRVGGIAACPLVTVPNPYETAFATPLLIALLINFTLIVLLQTPWLWRRSSWPVIAGRLAWSVGGLGLTLVMAADEVLGLSGHPWCCTVVEVAALTLFATTIIATAESAPASRASPIDSGGLLPST